MGIIIGGGFLLIILIAVLFLYLSPQFGGVPTQEQRMAYAKSPNYRDGKFINKEEVKLDMSMRDMGKSLAGFFGSSPNTKPLMDIPVDKLDSLDIVHKKESTRLIWFGHSAFLLQIGNKTILIDPMFGKVPAPHPLLATNRFSKELPIAVEKLPSIDAVLISHDHYDHLDYGSIQKLKNKVKMFYTPLGVGAHLREWGVERERIIEMDWWQEISQGDLIIRCTPAQHFSGRGITDRAKTLWSSWVLQSNKDKIFFSGDSGYGPHFKEIGDKFGPFNIAMLECGQYNEMWPDIHMFPEQTAQAGVDVRSRLIIPIHWGAFKLAMHPWTEPVERVSVKAKELNLEVLTPRIGEPINFNKMEVSTSEWWK